MSNPSGAKGTKAETALVEYLRANGWPSADRRAPNGRLDRGDVTGTPGLCFEQKWATRMELPAWLRELEVETVNAHADHGVLVVKPTGVGLSSQHNWWAIQRLSNWIDLARHAGYGNTP